MIKEAVFTMKLEPQLRAEFVAEAEAAHRPASQILRELMRNFIQDQKDKREYELFLHSKVTKARGSIKLGLGRSNDDVESDFRAKRNSA
jgi:hypothetical protein